jgi:hypothetical protein
MTPTSIPPATDVPPWSKTRRTRQTERVPVGGSSVTTLLHAPLGFAERVARLGANLPSDVFVVEGCGQRVTYALSSYLEDDARDRRLFLVARLPLSAARGSLRAQMSATSVCRLAGQPSLGASVLWQVVAEVVASEQVNVRSPAVAALAVHLHEAPLPASLAPPSVTPPPPVAVTAHPPRPGELANWTVSTFDKPRADQLPNMSHPSTLTENEPPLPQVPDAT